MWYTASVKFCPRRNETPMWNRLKAILADFIQQADLVLLGLCCAATLYGMVLIASATRYMGADGIIRYVGVQGAAMALPFFRQPRADTVSLPSWSVRTVRILSDSL